MPDSSNPYLGQQNPYLQSNIDNTMGDMTRQYNLTTQPAFNSAMVHSGSFGNAGVDQMNSNANLNQQKAQGATSAAMRMQDYGNQQSMYQWDQGFNRSLYNDAYGQNQTNLQTGLGLLGTQAGYNTNNLNNGTTIQNTPFNYWSQFSNAANGLGNNFGSTTGTVGTTSNPFVSALGGAQLGSSALGWWNRNNPSSGGSDTSASLNASGQANGYGNTFSQNGNSPDVSYG
jgi:hypothetical protein